MTLNKLTTLLKEKTFKKQWKSATVILDEYDWIMFDGSADRMFQKLKLFSKVN